MMIKKTKIINGMYYIEIPEASLYIQCGSPVESAKHLIKRGFIRPITKNGVTYECGPNAILLSDVTLQNGLISNMTEFSVLQMLYNQGLIIPNHPNNSGEKPLLIGLNSQIDSQMHYIHRGNYGLISEDEITSCGISEEYAKELFRLKLKFAFGELKPANDLLDSCIIEKNKVEIKNDVFIERKEINIFEISFKDEKITIDLNLKECETYASPYILPLYNLKREYFSVIHSGQGDGWDVNRASMNSIITFQGRLYLVDVVPNIKSLLKSLSIDINEIEGVFQTHTHDDHIGGISTLIRSDKKIKFYATPLVLSATTKKLSALLEIEEDEFHNLVDIQELKLEEWNDIYGLEVKPMLSPHPVETTTFIFRTLFEDGYKTYGHYADIIDLSVLEQMIVKNKNEIGISRKLYDKTVADYKQKLDLKKIDIGGGMIHGNSADFKNDLSEKIVLAHYSTKLKKDAKKVGSASLFGLSDILIPTHHNYDFTILYDHISSNFPNMEYYQKKMFLNFNICHFNPETILIREGEKIENAYLLLSGQVEGISSKKDDITLFSPGVILGEKTVFTNTPPPFTYVTKNYVKALEIPVKFFYHFVEKNNLLSYTTNKIKKREFLLKTKLFKDEIGYHTLDKLVGDIKKHTIKKGEIEIATDRVYLISAGKIEVKIDKILIKSLKKYDDFGGIKTMLKYDCSCKYYATTEVLLYSISCEVLNQIPIVRWKMIESVQKLMETFEQCKVIAKA
jgi:hemerythrin